MNLWKIAPAEPLRDPHKILRVRFQEPMQALSPKGQLVDIMDSMPGDLKPPRNSRFLSDRNRSVPQETQARVTGPNPNRSSGRRPSLSHIPPSGKVKWDIPKSILQEETQLAPQKFAMHAPSNYLPEIAMGDETLLNTRQYAYATFFVRMKRQMEAVWNPRSVIHSERLSRDQYITRLSITLRGDGSIYDLRIARGSGQWRLDRAAAAAVQRAAPYINPPPQLVEADGLIHIPEWSFIVTLRARY